MRDYRSQNDRTIKNAIKKATAEIDGKLEKSIRNATQSGMVTAIQAHDAKHPLHTRFADSYGSAVFHSGREVSREINSGMLVSHRSNDTENAHLALNGLPQDPDVRGSRYAGVVLASMEPDYFSWEHEKGYLNIAKAEALSVFTKEMAI